MAITGITEQRVVLAAFAVLVAAVYTWAARATCGKSVVARYGVGAGVLAMGALVMLGIVAPAVAYALICLAMVAVYVVDLVLEERARRRRVASLVPRPRVTIVPALWAVAAALSTALVAPYVLDESNRFAASVVALCSVAMAAISWRIASAPVQLEGRCDIEMERRAVRATRASKSGVASILACGNVFVFASFANQASGGTPLERTAGSFAFFVWIGVAALVALYVALGFLPVRRTA